MKPKTSSTVALNIRQKRIIPNNNYKRGLSYNRKKLYLSSRVMIKYKPKGLYGRAYFRKDFVSENWGEELIFGMLRYLVHPSRHNSFGVPQCKVPDMIWYGSFSRAIHLCWHSYGRLATPYRRVPISRKQLSAVATLLYRFLSR